VAESRPRGILVRYGRRSKVYPVRIGPRGASSFRLVRKERGLRSGDTRLCGAAGDRMVLELRRVAEAGLWAHFSGVGGSLAQELIGERRPEA